LEVEPTPEIEGPDVTDWKKTTKKRKRLCVGVCSFKEWSSGSRYSPVGKLSKQLPSDQLQLCSVVLRMEEEEEERKRRSQGLRDSFVSFLPWLRSSTGHRVPPGALSVLRLRL